MKFLVFIVFAVISLSAFSMTRPVSTNQRDVIQYTASIASTGVISGLDKYVLASTSTGTGVYQITFPENFPVADYSIIVTPTNATTTHIFTFSKAVGSAIIHSVVSGTTTPVASSFDILIMGSKVDTRY